MNMRFFLFALTLAYLSSCSDDPDPNTVVVNLQLSHLVDNEALQLDQMIYTNAAGQEFSVKTLKYFISDFKVHKIDGGFIPFDDILYIDVREPESLLHTLSKKIAPGEYAGISFVHGLARDQNITNRFTEPPESLMEWPVMMGGGYHYMKLEGDYIARASSGFFNFHSGSLDGTDYAISVDLADLPFDVNNELNIELKMEIQNWFTNPVDWDFEYFGSGIMGNSEAQRTVQRNGRDVYSFSIIEN
jgi:hypothetical protein